MGRLHGPDPTQAPGPRSMEAGNTSILSLPPGGGTKNCSNNNVWVLVSEPDFCIGFGSLPWKSNKFTRNEAQE